MPLAELGRVKGRRAADPGHRDHRPRQQRRLSANQRAAPERQPAAKVVREVFVDANNFMESGPLILDVIAKLEDAIDFHDPKARGQLGSNTFPHNGPSISVCTTTS